MIHVGHEGWGLKLVAYGVMVSLIKIRKSGPGWYGSVD